MVKNVGGILLAAMLAASFPAFAQDAPGPGNPACQKLAAEYSASRRGISMLVMLDGKVVFEDYPSGGRPDRTHELASGAKSFSGVLAAAAVQDGLFRLEDLVADTIAEWKDDRRKARVTIRQLLTLTSGIRSVGEAGRVPSYADAVAMPLVDEPGERFKYGPVPFQVFGELMRRKLADRQENAVDYLIRRVLDPIGVKIGSWRKGADGNPTMSFGAWLTARDWARFGEFVRLGGTWEGKEIVSRELLEECFRGTAANPAYGLTWWLNRPVAAGQRQRLPMVAMATDIFRGDRLPPDLAMAAGAGNQRLYVSREWKLVVVRQGGPSALAGDRSVNWSDTEFLCRLLYGQGAAKKAVEPGREPSPDAENDRAGALERLR